MHLYNDSTQGSLFHTATYQYEYFSLVCGLINLYTIGYLLKTQRLSSIKANNYLFYYAQQFDVLPVQSHCQLEAAEEESSDSITILGKNSIGRVSAVTRLFL